MHNLYLRRLHVIKSTRPAGERAAADAAVVARSLKQAMKPPIVGASEGAEGQSRAPPIGLEEKSNRDALSPGAR